MGRSQRTDHSPGPAGEESVAAAVTARADRAQVPLSIALEITRRCDLACVHCYAESPSVGVRPAHDELSRSDWFGVLDQAAELGALYVTITGGEPLVRPDVFDLLAHAREAGFAVRLFTNATLVDEPAADRIAGLGLVSVEVSLYAADAAIHDGITGVAGSHVRTLRGILALKALGVNVIAKTCVMQANVDTLRSLFGLVDEMEIPIRIDPMLTATNSCDLAPTRLRISQAQYEEMLRALVSRGASLDPVERRLDAPVCGAGRTMLAVGATGEVYPCTGYPVAAGDLRTESLAHVWRESEALRAIRVRAFADQGECASCELAPFCRICPGSAILEQGATGKAVPFSCMGARACRTQAGQGADDARAVRRGMWRMS